MSYHVIDISSPVCSLSCRDRQLVCKAEGQPERRLPLEDVAAIVVNSFSASFHSRLLVEAAKLRVALILCERFRPVSLVLPANRSTDTLLTRSQIALPRKLKTGLWQKTIDAKCGNQVALARKLLPEDRAVRLLEGAALARHPRKEGTCAHHYWKILAQALGQDDFTRGSSEHPLNGLFNYGYTVLLARCLQKFMAVGIDPTFGIGHAIRERATPLAYDLMEPFRPIIDARIVAWFREGATHVQSGPSGGDFDPCRVSQPYKAWVQQALDVSYPYGNAPAVKVANIIEQVGRSFRGALLAGRLDLYKPWTQRNSKWAG